LILTLNSSVYIWCIFKLTLKQDPLNLLTDVVSPVKNFCEIKFEVLLLVLQFRLLEVKVVVLILLVWESHSGQVRIEVFREVQLLCQVNMWGCWIVLEKRITGIILVMSAARTLRSTAELCVEQQLDSCQKGMPAGCHHQLTPAT